MYNFEIHITVKLDNNYESFKLKCHELGVKPIIINLKNNTYVDEHIMTSLTKSFNSLSDAIYLAELHKKNII